MNLPAALLLLAWLATLLATQEPSRPPTPASFRYSRTLSLHGTAPSVHSPFACAVLDAGVFAHTDAAVSDLRIYDMGRDAREVPYVITLSSAPGSPEPARVLNLGLKSANRISFDLRMPPRPYSAVDLQLNAVDFIASATLTGLRSPRDTSPTYLGAFTLFDLTSQRLGHNQHLEFAESIFPYLHLDLRFTPAPAARQLKVAASIVTGADVPASRLAQIPYTPVLSTSAIEQQSRRSVATFKVPAHVPIERIAFELDSKSAASFSRHVLISASPDPSPSDASAYPEQLSGEISRVHLDEAGREIRDEALTVPALLGSNAQSSATIQVAIENGDDQPVAIKAVRLEMRQRELCFDLSAANPPSLPGLFYGAAGVSLPAYDLGRLFDPAKPVLVLSLGPEQPNPLLSAAPTPPRPFTERHPAVLWLALIAVVAVLGSVAVRSAKRL